MTVQEAERLVALWCAGQPIDDLPQWRTAMQVIARELSDTRARVADERERWAPLVDRLAESLAARLGTNADEWPDVLAARAALWRP